MDGLENLVVSHRPVVDGLQRTSETSEYSDAELFEVQKRRSLKDDLLPSAIYRRRTKKIELLNL